MQHASNLMPLGYRGCPYAQCELLSRDALVVSRSAPATVAAGRLSREYPSLWCRMQSMVSAFLKKKMGHTYTYTIASHSHLLWVPPVCDPGMQSVHPSSLLSCTHHRSVQAACPTTGKNLQQAYNPEMCIPPNLTDRLILVSTQCQPS
jgi:hypothetical protein